MAETREKNAKQPGVVTSTAIVAADPTGAADFIFIFSMVQVSAASRGSTFRGDRDGLPRQAALENHPAHGVDRGRHSARAPPSIGLWNRRLNAEKAIRQAPGRAHVRTAQAVGSSVAVEPAAGSGGGAPPTGYERPRRHVWRDKAAA